MLTRSLLVLLVTVATVYAELPDTVSASKCRRHKKIYALLDDGGGTDTARIIKIPSAFYYQVGSLALYGCKTFKGTGECQANVTLGLLLAPGFTGELPCSSVLYFNYSFTSEPGGQSE